MALAPDTILQNRYRVVCKLGEGGMGSVYLATDERFDSEVAIKESHSTDDAARRQFEREARLLNRLRHNAMTRVIDHFTEGDGQFIVMDYVKGADLWHMLKQRDGAFPPNQVLAWADQLLDALSYLHGQDPPIIHRDIKPQNLKLSDTGQIILLDFGLAKGTLGQSTSMMTSRSVFGYTPLYAPLEQITAGGTDARSDIYSLGATLYHLITGIIPADAPTRYNVIEEDRPDPLRPANEVNPNVTIEVANVLRKAMAVNRRERFATAAEMREALLNAGQFPNPVYSGAAETITQPRAVIPPAQAQSPPGLIVSATSPVITPAPEPSVETQRPYAPPFRPAKKSNRALWLVLLLAGISITAGLLFLIFAKPKSGTSNVNQSNTPAAAENLPTPENTATTEGQIKTLTGHSEAVKSVAVSPDGQQIVSASADGTIKLWDARTGALAQTLEESGNEVVSVAFSSDGKLLAVGLSGSDGRGSAIILDSSSGKLGEVRQKLPENNINTVAISPDGTTVAIGNISGTLKLWDSASGTVKQALEGQDVQTRSVAFSPDGKSVAGGGYGNTVKIWDAETGALRRTLSGHSSEIMAVAFSPDGKTVASGSFDYTVRLWDSETGALKRTLTGADFLVSTVAFSPGGRLVAGGANHNLLVWDAQTGILKQTLQDDLTSINTIAYSPDGKMIVSGNVDGTVKLFNMGEIR
ncbi:MAG TPA: protein kinase [Pyrinomonadaceae bacterium]|nr:protein kinase [Pyrinomonadaceae bacterium]